MTNKDSTGRMTTQKFNKKKSDKIENNEILKFGRLLQNASSAAEIRSTSNVFEQLLSVLDRF